MDDARKERFAQLIQNVDKLPPLPAITAKLVQVVNSPDSSAEDASSLISKDPALTGKMLRLANSAFYGIPRSISSVNSAVVILGFNTIKSLVLSTAVLKALNAPTQKVIGRESFWRHSIVTALAARVIVRSIMSYKLLDPESAFCAGILHDIGKLIFESFAPDDYVEALAYSQAHTCSLYEAEKMVLGVAHTDIGRMVAEKWALPMDLEAAMLHHHTPADAGPISDLVTVVNLADAISHQLGAVSVKDEVAPSVWDQARSVLKIDDAHWQRIVDTMKDEISKSDEFYGIVNQEYDNKR